MIHAHIPGPNPPGDPVQPLRVWTDPHTTWQDRLYEQLLARRIVLASGVLDDEAAARLSAQLLTLDAEGNEPVRLELQNLRAELSPVITIMGILDVMRVEVHAIVSGNIGGPALGLLASCPRRTARPNATMTLTEPHVRLSGTAASISSREQQIVRMTDTLYYRLAEATGRPVAEIRDDARRGRVLTSAQAIGYGLIEAEETRTL